MKKWALYIGWFCGCLLFLTARRTYAQLPIVLHDSTDLPKFSDLSTHIQVYKGSFKDSLIYPDMLRGPWQEIGTDSIIIRRKDFKCSSWIRFTLQNSHSQDTLKLLLNAGRYDLLLTAYCFAGNSLLSTYRAGWIDKPTVPLWAWSADNFALPLVVPPQSQRTFWINKIYFYAPIVERIAVIKIMTPSGYNAFKALRIWQTRGLILFFGFIVGVCLFLGVSGLFQFILTNDITYLWWALYLCGMFLFFLRPFELYTNIRVMSGIFPGYYMLSLGPIQNATQIGYFLFFDSFLKIRQHSLSLHRAIRVFVGLLLIYLAYSLTLFFNPLGSFSHIRGVLTNVFDVCMLLFVAVLLISTARKKIRLSRFLILGSGCAYTGLIITFYMNRVLISNSTEHLWAVPSSYFGAGILAEVFLFSLALSFRWRTVETEKNRLQQTYTVNLETELARRTQTIWEQSKITEDLHIQRLASEFDQKLAQTEMAALRAQMNPHFIFNCLNSIQFFTAQNDAEKASDYLTKFSRLIRLVLENSKSERVTLANELETLRLYIEMEAMRFQQKVHFAIEVAEAIDTDLIQMPPLLLQPFVENAIWHGLMHKEEGGTVRVVVEQPAENLLRVDITDDGVGRVKAAEYKSKSATRNKSFGMKMTAERIELINQLYHTQTQVQIEDLADAEGVATGTKVVVEIPI